jgi:hypothetical protein
MTAITKESQLAYRKKSPRARAIVPEASIQSAVDDYLAVINLRSVRIPDAIWRWIAAKAPTGVRMWFGRVFGGLPDNIVLIPLNERYALALLLELKTTAGQLHGKQKTESKRLPWRVARSVEEAVEIINQAERDAESYGRQLQGGKDECVAG